MLDLLMTAIALLVGRLLPANWLGTVLHLHSLAMLGGFLCLFAPRAWQRVALRALLFVTLVLWRWTWPLPTPPELAMASVFCLLLGLLPLRDEGLLERRLRGLSVLLLAAVMLGVVNPLAGRMAVDLQVTSAPLFLLLGGTAILNRLRARAARRWEAETRPRLRENWLVFRFRMRAILRPVDTAARIRQLYL